MHKTSLLKTGRIAFINPPRKKPLNTTAPAGSTTASKWTSLRTTGDSRTAQDAICGTIPEGMEIASLEHLRTAHYAVYRVQDTAGSKWVARVGVVSPHDELPVDNTGYLGTSTFSPSGQFREHLIASGFHAANADVCPSAHYAVTPDDLDVLWMPFIDSIDSPLSAAQWHHAMTSLYSYSPDQEMPVFTNRTKTFDRIKQLPRHIGDDLRHVYDIQLQELFEAATRWSVVHGDAHSGNAVNDGTNAVLFDFDTACWAPSVWDLTHLLNRAGTDGNTGYTASELRSLFPFTDDEVSAALALRKTAALVAKRHRELTDCK